MLIPVQCHATFPNLSPAPKSIPHHRIDNRLSEGGLVLLLLGLLRVGLEGRVADDLGDLGGLLQGPLALLGIAEGGVDVLAPDDGDGATGLVEDLAAESGVLVGADGEGDGLEWALVSYGVLGRALAVVNGGLGAGRGGLVAQDDADLVA